MNDHYSSGARSYRALQRMKIHLPAVVVDQRIGHEADIVQLGKEIEQRIAGLRDQQFISRIAEQAKNVGVAFAGAGREDQLFGIKV